jgi:hypothetical protein
VIGEGPFRRFGGRPTSGPDRLFTGEGPTRPIRYRRNAWVHRAQSRIATGTNRQHGVAKEAP